MTSPTNPQAPVPVDGEGPYRAEFGAVHHEDQPGFLFTVTPAKFADDVATAMNAMTRASGTGEGEAWRGDIRITRDLLCDVSHWLGEHIALLDDEAVADKAQDIRHQVELRIDNANYAALAQPPRASGGEVWRHPDMVPHVKAGGEEWRIVAVRRAHNGTLYRFPATYLNQYTLRFEDENEERPVTGWFSAVTGEDDEGETYHELLSKGDVLEAWCDLPPVPSDAILSALQAQAGEGATPI